ncbi:MAG: hypothetical protein H7X94_12445, partial [Vallitaleaceae bacterium]|nr:hypothetical protein [Vallitaleaceae bacterium]
MIEEKIQFVPKFIQSERIKALEKRNMELALTGKRKLYGWYEGDEEGRAYGAYIDQPYVPSPEEKKTDVGDHACWIDMGKFPLIEELPSKKYGYEMNAESWGRDYAFLLDNTPPTINAYERIVGEIYWEMHMVRRYDWADVGEEFTKKRWEARCLGASGTASGHCCPDLEIGIKQGFGGILERIQKSKDKYTYLNNSEKVS